MPCRLPITCIVLTCLLSVLIQGCARSKATLMTKKYAPAKLKEDAELLGKVIFEMHPAVGIYESRDVQEQKFVDYVNSLNDSLTEREFRLRTKLVLDELHCGHTEVLYSSRFYKQIKHLKLNYSPYIFLPVKDKLFLIADLNKTHDSTFKKGAQVVSINGVPSDSMLRHSKRFISGDGHNSTGKDHFAQLGFNGYFPALFGRPDTFGIEYLDGKLKKRSRYAAIKLKDMPQLPLGPHNDSLYKRYRSAKIRYRFLDEDKKTMVMKIDKFSHNRDGHAYRKIFKMLKENNTENLVIDLRNNGGGSLANSYRLLSYLLDSAQTQTLRTRVKHYPYRSYVRGNWAFKMTRFSYKIIGKKVSRHDTDDFVYTIKPKKKNHYDKKIFVLINGGSYSASCLVASYLSTTGRAVYIGEETGGAREGCNAGITPFYKLPNTNIRVRVPAFRVLHDVSPAITGRGILPDYQINYSLKDLVSRKDLELEKVQELLKAPAKP